MPSLIVIGSGIAGLVAALTASSTHVVTLVTKAELSESNTFYAQGGIAAAVFDDDSVEEHIADTLRAGAGLNTLEAVEALCTEGPERIRDLIRFGVAFDHRGNQLARGLEAAHSRARVLHAGGDATGAAIETALINAIRASNVRVLEHSFVTDLIVRDAPDIKKQILADPNTGFEVKEDRGILIAKLERNSPAAQGGMKPGDVLKKVGGKSVENAEQVQQIVEGSTIGSDLSIEVNRNGQSVTITVKPGAFPTRSAAVE